jgi:hypothetical protein
MRDYILTRAIASESYGFTFANLFRNWKARRSLARFPEGNEHLLRDLGIVPADIDWARRLPLTQNPLLALEERGLHNRTRR